MAISAPVRLLDPPYSDSSEAGTAHTTASVTPTGGRPVVIVLHYQAGATTSDDFPVTATFGGVSVLPLVASARHSRVTTIIYVVANPTTSAQVFSFATTNTARGVIVEILEIPGGDTTAPVASVIAEVSNSSSNVLTLSGTTTTDGSLALYAGTMRSNGQTMLASGVDGQLSQQVSDTDRFRDVITRIAYETVATAGAAEAEFSWPTAEQNSGVAIEIKAAAGGGPTERTATVAAASTVVTAGARARSRATLTSGQSAVAAVASVTRRRIAAVAAGSTVTGLAARTRGAAAQVSASSGVVATGTRSRPTTVSIAAQASVTAAGSSSSSNTRATLVAAQSGGAVAATRVRRRSASIAGQSAAQARAGTEVSRAAAVAATGQVSAAGRRTRAARALCAGQSLIAATGIKSTANRRTVGIAAASGCGAWATRTRARAAVVAAQSLLIVTGRIAGAGGVRTTTSAGSTTTASPLGASRNFGARAVGASSNAVLLSGSSKNEAR